MTEPTERDRQIGQKIADSMMPYVSRSERDLGYEEEIRLARLSKAMLVAELLAAAREAGRREERERCASLINEIFGDQDGGLAGRIRSGE